MSDKPIITIVSNQGITVRRGDKKDGGGHTGDGPPPGGPTVEARVAVLENNVDHIKSDITEIKSDVKDLMRAHDRDFRILFGALIAATLGLAGLMAKGFHWI